MENLFEGIYINRRVLVTGHTGFKGSWLCTWLHELGADVIGYALAPNTEPSMFHVCNLKNKITNIIGDIRDLEHLNSIMQNYKPEIVFHLAAQPLVRSSYEDPKITYESNVIGTLNVYEACRRCTSVKAIVCITTDKVYENREWVYGYREEDRLGGYDPYSSSKACSEILTASYKKSYFDSLGIQIATVRAGNVIGGGDWAKDRLVPDAIRYLVGKQTISMRNPLSTRPWQHVLEPLSGYLWLGYHLLSHPNQFNSCWNFGPDDEANQTVEVIIKGIISRWQSGSYLLEKGNNPHEANLLKLDISKAKHYLGWYPIYDYNTALEQTVNWYRAFYENNEIDMYDLTVKQINHYVDAARNIQALWSRGERND